MPEYKCPSLRDIKRLLAKPFGVTESVPGAVKKNWLRKPICIRFTLENWSEVKKPPA